MKLLVQLTLDEQSGEIMVSYGKMMEEGFLGCNPPFVHMAFTEWFLKSLMMHTLASSVLRRLRIFIEVSKIYR